MNKTNNDSLMGSKMPVHDWGALEPSPRRARERYVI
jgi:hypothetical protein